jgi:CRP-like cAMP-binding protein
LAASSSHDIAPLIAKLESTVALTERERQAVESLPMQVQALKSNQDIVRVGDRPSHCFVLLDGYTATYKVTGDGKRQIHAFHVPGDIPDLQSLHLKVLDNSIVTLTRCRVGFISHEHLRNLCRREPRIMEALWRQTLIDGAVYREWMTNVGQRAASNRLAHLFCEWMLRMRAVGLAEGNACDLPMTQAELADAMGVTTVHVNRVLQEIRGKGLITLQGSRLEILDWDELQRVGDFDPLYLHQDPAEVAE